MPLDRRGSSCSWNAASRPETREPPPDEQTRLIRLSAAVAAKKSSERLISPITVSVTVRIACSTSCGTTSWLVLGSLPPILMRSASSKLDRERLLDLLGVLVAAGRDVAREGRHAVREDVDVHGLRADVDERDHLVGRAS